ncbi:hypothetical protein [Niabella hibiscisoli]|uniref:hypothetical protein n=1 Tax=Niabella hibiscisoli TaxID=1825928 RepID=UPI001F0D5E7B|nr:hypothetical protein [Niabella hibiscisoli]MCH5718254.1 hypothetical protein [Niabella hibiscisoli]
MKIIFCCLLVLYQVTGLGQKNITGTEQCKMAARQSYQYLIKKLNITEAAQKDSIKSIQEDFFALQQSSMQ